jgi:uncharacterized protein YjbJ (UPF0337 family)
MKRNNRPDAKFVSERSDPKMEPRRSNDGSAAASKIPQKPNPADTAQEAVHEVMPKTEVPPAPPSTRLAPVSSPHVPLAAPVPMSHQQQASMPSTDELKGKWKQRVGAAKVAWGKLSEDELLKSEGHAQKLAGLVQERYAITRDEADKQVKSFFDKR